MGIFTNPARDEQGNELRRRRTDQIPFSIVASDMTVIGDLETEGVVRIEGRIRGTVRAAAQVLVAAGAVIEGDLHTQEAVVAGQVSGAIHARDRVELQASAIVTGDILTPRIAIVEGAKVSGEVKMDQPDGAQPASDSHKS
ncbi:MAG TPA: polymer-forming cytoskeletal protein [Gemmatimonadales bacterium]|jgi:cytoskeletal protein CcmA (bactofilin family)|nr:polymer-forming cytoskeletal protein [Gemmatimonadales bacterium]